MEYWHEKKKYILSGRLQKYIKSNISNFHWHENLEICRIANKPCKFIVEGKVIVACPGDIVVFDEYMAHQFVVENENTEIYIIQMDLNCFVNQSAPLKPLRMHITNEEINEVPGLNEKINRLIEFMTDEQPSRESVSENSFLYSTMAALYYLLLRYFPAEESMNKSGRNEFYKIIEYINNHYTEDITVESLAKVMFVSSKTLTNLFRKFSGMSISDYVNYLRIKSANIMLLHGESVTTAALECGFRSVRTFNNVYKKIMNTTPSEYLKTALNK